MAINFKSMMEIEHHNYKKSFSVSLIAVLLISSLAIGMFAGQAMGQSTIHVGTETELRAAVSNAANGVPVDITLDREIGLTGSALSIPSDKEITLRSNGNAEFELFGASGANTITVENRGTLTLAGITATHTSGSTGLGVSISSGGKLTMTGGKISNNTSNGVTNGGSFTMTGGTISNNTGYGVYTSGTNSNFTMTGGEISNNRYGVQISSVTANFNMANGRISDNTGVGVSNAGTFSMFGGEISNNIVNTMNSGAYSSMGGGVYNSGTFTMSGGKISNNKIDNIFAGNGVGIYNVGTFIMSGGEISNNIATGNFNGGGVFTSGTFTMSGGEISKNTATNGGGIYVSNGNVDLQGGRITGNTATRHGGGCWVTDTSTNFNRLTVRNGVVFSDNRASASYSRGSEHDSTYRAYIEDNVQWTSPFTQGYNNFDISYVVGKSVSQFTVTVDDAHGKPTGAGSYSVGDTVTLDAGTQSGYTFSHWVFKEGDVYLYNRNTPTITFTMPASNVDVVAIWKGVQYKIVYELNGGKTDWRRASEYPATYTYYRDGSSVAISDPTKEESILTTRSYKFLDWTVTYADGTQEHFRTSLNIPAGTMGDITLEANWASLSLWQKILSGLEGIGAIIGIIIVVIVIILVVGAVCAVCGGSSGGSSGGSTHYGGTSPQPIMCEGCGQYPAQDGWTLCSNCLRKRHMALSSM